MSAYVDASVLIGLGTVGELDRLSVLTADVVVLPGIRDEVTTEPARTAVQEVIDTEVLAAGFVPDGDLLREAASILDEPETTADAQLIAAVLGHRRREEPVAVVSDDGRVRTVARGLGATVSGTVGVVVRAVDEGLDPAEAKAIVRRLDQHGLHMTANLRQRAEDLIHEAIE